MHVQIIALYHGTWWCWNGPHMTSHVDEQAARAAADDALREPE